MRKTQLLGAAKNTEREINQASERCGRPFSAPINTMRIPEVRKDRKEQRSIQRND
jgi:hypothetical protein